MFLLRKEVQIDRKHLAARNHFTAASAEPHTGSRSHFEGLQFRWIGEASASQNAEGPATPERACDRSVQVDAAGQSRSHLRRKGAANPGADGSRLAVSLECHCHKRDQGLTIICGDPTTDVAPVGARQAHRRVRSPARGQNPRQDRRASARAGARRALDGSKARKSKSTTSSTDIRHLHLNKKKLAERSPDENDRDRGQADQRHAGQHRGNAKTPEKRLKTAKGAFEPHERRRRRRSRGAIRRTCSARPRCP